MIEWKIFIKNPEKISRMLGHDVKDAAKKGMVHAMRRSVIRLADYIASEKLSGQELNVRTGNLRRSLQESRARKVQEIAGGVRGTVGTNVEYAEVHERGGTIRPKSKKWLTIPIGEALTASGVPRGSARDFDNTFFAHSRRGNLILFTKKGDGIIPLFVLKKTVKIPRRAYMEPSLEEKHSELIRFFMNDVKEFVGKAWGKAS